MRRGNVKRRSAQHSTQTANTYKLQLEHGMQAVQGVHTYLAIHVLFLLLYPAEESPQMESVGLSQKTDILALILEVWILLREYTNQHVDLQKLFNYAVVFLIRNLKNFIKYHTNLPCHLNTLQKGCSLFQHPFSQKGVKLQIRVFETKKQGVKKKRV